MSTLSVFMTLPCVLSLGVWKDRALEGLSGGYILTVPASVEPPAHAAL